MVPILDGNSEHVAHALRKIGLFGENNPICDSFWPNCVLITDQITEIAPYMHTNFWVTIWYKYHGFWTNKM